MVSSGPHAIHMGKRDVSRMRTVVLRLGGQKTASPSGVAPQLKSRTSSPIFRPSDSRTGNTSTSANSLSMGRSLRSDGHSDATFVRQHNGHAGGVTPVHREEQPLSMLSLLCSLAVF